MLGLFFYPTILLDLHALPHSDHGACQSCARAEYGNGSSCNRPYKDGIPSLSTELAQEHEGFMHESLVSDKPVSQLAQDYVLSPSKFANNKPRIAMHPNCFLTQNRGLLYFNDSSPDLLDKWQEAPTSGPLKIHVLVRTSAPDVREVTKVIMGGQNNLKPYEMGSKAKITVYAASANYSDALSTEETCSLSRETQDLIASLSKLLKSAKGLARGHPLPNFSSASDVASLTEVLQATCTLAEFYGCTDIHVLASSAGTRAVTPLLLLLKSVDIVASPS